MSEKQSITYLFASAGARTERGGWVMTDSKIIMHGLPIAAVGDIVQYEDGGQAVIVDGAGGAMVFGNQSCALVGSRLSNGDRVVSTFSTLGITVANGEQISGLFDPSYAPEPSPPGYRQVVRGATSARGGVVQNASGETAFDSKLGRAAMVGDQVHYADGSTATIVNGVVMKDRPSDIAYAIVGSQLSNGDVITDSPERKGILSPSLFALTGPMEVTDMKPCGAQMRAWA